MIKMNKFKIYVAYLIAAFVLSSNANTQLLHDHDIEWLKMPNLEFLFIGEYTQ